jgi:hypothetical protein
MSELINYSPDLKQRKIGVRESFESKCTYRASHIRLISEFVLYATKNTNYADHLIPFIMWFYLVIHVGM